MAISDKLTITKEYIKGLIKAIHNRPINKEFDNYMVKRLEFILEMLESENNE